MKAPVRVVLVRHGRKADTRCNVDGGLAAEGNKQAIVTGARVRQWHPPVVASSDMLRASETSDLINDGLSAARIIDPRPRELDFGLMEGLEEHEFTSRFSGFQREQALMRKDLRYPKSENAGEVAAGAPSALSDLAIRADPAPQVHCSSSLTGSSFEPSCASDWERLLPLASDLARTRKRFADRDPI